MKKMISINCWRTLVASMAIMTSMSASSLYAAVYTNANVAADLTNATRWIGGVVPTWAGTSVLVWDNTLTTPAACTNATGGGTLNVRGLVVLDPVSDVYVTNTSSKFCLNSQTSLGIDLSSAQKNLTIAGGIVFEHYQVNGISYTSTLSVAAGRRLTFQESVTHRGAAINITNQGVVAYKKWNLSMNQGQGSIINLMGGTLTNEGSIAMEIANDVGHKGAVYQSGGAFYPYSAKLANKASSGTYVLSGGTAFFSGDLLINFGGTGTGEVAVTSGTLTQSGGLFAVGNGAGIAYYTQSGGTVTVYTNSIASGTGIGMFTISNGTFNATAFGQLASGVGATGIMLLAGGTTTLPAFPTTRGVNASAIVTFDGGTLSPRASTNGYLRGLTAAYVTTNGAVLDTAGYDITISQKLEDYSGHTGRLVKKGAGTLTLSGTNTYSGATIVTNGVLSQTHAQCLSASSTVYLYSTATNNLSFEGTNTIRRLYVDNVLQQEKKAYSKTQFAVLSGNGYYYVTEGAKAPGTMVSFF